MSLEFAALESTLSNTVITAFENIRLVAGAATFGAVLDRAVDKHGEYSLTSERRDRITLLKAAATAAALTPGLAVAVDPAFYTPAQITAMVKSSWKLDRMESDDGHVVEWWLK